MKMMYVVVLLFSSLSVIVAYLLFKGSLLACFFLSNCQFCLYAVCRTRRPVACTEEACCTEEPCTGERFVVQGKAVWTVRCSSGSQQQLSIQRPQQQPAMEEQLGCTGEMARLQVHSTATFVASFLMVNSMQKNQCQPCQQETRHNYRSEMV